MDTYTFFVLARIGDDLYRQEDHQSLHSIAEAIDYVEHTSYHREQPVTSTHEPEEGTALEQARAFNRYLVEEFGETPPYLVGVATVPLE